MFDPILRAVGAFLAWIDSWAGNYAIALLIFTIILELVFLPFGIKQQKNSIRQAMLRPKEMAIRKKYAGRNDKVTQQKVMQEIQELYQKENYSQFAGCLPMILQLVALLLIYNVVSNPLKFVVGLDDATISELGSKILGADVGKQTIGLLTKIQDLGLSELKAMGISEVSYGILEAKFDSLPNFHLFGNFMNLGDTPTVAWNSLLIIPAVTFVSYFLSTKLTRKLTYQPTTVDQQTGCSNKIMDIVMPLFSLFISFSVPAALGVYWIFKSILGTLKQFILFKAMPLPVFTEEDYKAAEKELKGKAPAPEREVPENIKSLCHEDDDDDEPYPTFVGVKGGRYDDDSDDKPAKETKSEQTQEKSKMGKKLDAAPLKDDEKKAPKESEEPKETKENEEK